MYARMHACSVMSDSLWPMDCSLPGSSVHGIFQARILEWIAMPSSRGCSRPRDWLLSLLSPHWQAGSLLLVPPGKFRALRPHIKVRYKTTNEIGSNGERNWLCGSLLPTHIEYTKRLGKSGREFLDHCCASPQGKGIRGSFVFTSEPKTRPLKKPFRESGACLNMKVR